MTKKFSDVHKALFLGAALFVFLPLGSMAAGVSDTGGVQLAQASNCSGTDSFAELSAIFPRGGEHDVWLIAEAVRAEVNKERCAAGIDPLEPDNALMEAAVSHTADMVEHGFFKHQSPLSGRETPSARINAAGGQFGTTAENLGQAWYVNYQAGRSFQVIDQDACQFAYTDGTPIQRHTYASLAEVLVAAWMASPGHRNNVLSPNAKVHGFAVGPTGDPGLCGQLYATQVFAG